MRCPASRDLAGVDVAVIGLPYDGGTSYRSGARFGPRKIREASLMLWAYTNPLAAQPLDALNVVDYSDADVTPRSILDTMANGEVEVGAALEAGATVLALGGDHSLSLPLLRAHRRRPGRLGVVHFDSHPDTWQSEFGGRLYSHRRPFRRALEEQLIEPARYIQVGLRGPTSGTRDWQDARDMGVRVIRMDAPENGGLMQRLGLLTGGGDAPRLNAVIRAVVKTAGNEFGCGIAGIEDGYDGLLMPDRAYMVTPEAVRGLVARGHQPGHRQSRQTIRAQGHPRWARSGGGHSRPDAAGVPATAAGRAHRRQRRRHAAHRRRAGAALPPAHRGRAQEHRQRSGRHRCQLWL